MFNLQIQSIKMEDRPNIQNLWTSASFSCKLFTIISVITYIFILVRPDIGYQLLDLPLLTIFSQQYWRPLTSILVVGVDGLSFLNLLFQFIWLRRLLKDRQGSTVYKIFQIIIIHLQIHLVYNFIVIFYIKMYYFAGIDYNQMASLMEILIQNQTVRQYLSILVGFGYGLFPTIIIYQFRDSVVDPDKPNWFCCLPFTIPSKCFPYVLIFFMFVMSGEYACYIAVFIVGCIQQVWMKTMIIKLPFMFYRLVQCLIPNFIKSRPDFVKIEQVQLVLKNRCLCQKRNYVRQQDMQIRQDPNQQRRSLQVFNQRQGVRIGGEGHRDLTRFENQQVVQGVPVGRIVTNSSEQQFEIEPRFVEYEDSRHRMKPQNNRNEMKEMVEQ